MSLTRPMQFAFVVACYSYNYKVNTNCDRN